MALFSTLWRKTTYWLKVFYALNALIIAASYGVIASILFSIVKRRGLAQYSTGRVFYWLIRPVLGIKIQFVGENYDKYFKPKSLWSLITNNLGSSSLPSSDGGEATDDFLRPCLIVSNHQSALDVYLIGRIFPPFCSVVSKKSLQYVPFLGWYMLLSGTVFLDRKNNAAAVRSLNGAVDSFFVRERQSVFMFPEGTRSNTKIPKLKTPLKKGAFHLAIQSQIPIVPVAISNTSSLFDSSKNILRAGTIEVKVLDPIPTVGLTRENVNELVSKTEKVLTEAIDELGYSQVDGEEKPEYKPRGHNPFDENSVPSEEHALLGDS